MMANQTTVLSIRGNSQTEGQETALSKLHRHSITGYSQQMRKQMLQDTFVLSGVALLGQWTTLYASPNTGKTLLTLWMLWEALRSDRVDGDRIFYINADDSYRGIVEKTELAEEWGFHLLAPNQNDFRSGDIVSLMVELSESGEARGTVIILDTLKKFTDLMQKKDATEFGIIARGYVAAGGTLICLAHTNKHRSAEGKSIYGGTSDISDDSDCVYILDKLDGQYFDERIAVEFENRKSRGDVQEKVSFTYRRTHGQSYADLVNTVQRIGDSEMSKLKAAAEVARGLESDKDAIDAIRSAIRSGVTSNSAIVKRINSETGISHRQIRKVLSERTGAVYALGHRWNCTTGKHNKQEYSVLEPTERDAST